MIKEYIKNATKLILWKLKMKINNHNTYQTNKGKMTNKQCQMNRIIINNFEL